MDIGALFDDRSKYNSLVNFPHMFLDIKLEISVMNDPKMTLACAK